jgi:hypothetical protein
MNTRNAQELLKVIATLSIYLQSHDDVELQQRLSTLVAEIRRRESPEDLDEVSYYGTYKPEKDCVKAKNIETTIQEYDNALDILLQRSGLPVEVYTHTVKTISDNFVNANKDKHPAWIIDRITSTPLEITWPENTPDIMKTDRSRQLVQFDVFLGLFWHYLCKFKKDDNDSRLMTGRVLITGDNIQRMYNALWRNMGAVKNIVARPDDDANIETRPDDDANIETRPDEPKISSHLRTAIKTVLGVAGLAAIGYLIRVSRSTEVLSGAGADISQEQADGLLKKGEDIIDNAGLQDLILACNHNCDTASIWIQKAMHPPAPTDTIYKKAEQQLILMGALRDVKWRDTEHKFAPMVFRTRDEIKQDAELLRAYNEVVKFMGYHEETHQGHI